MLNWFRLLGDFCNFSSIVVFVWIVHWKGNGSGVSLKAHQLYLVVFLTRYLDLFTSFYSFYNSFMKTYYILATASIVIALCYVEPAKSTYSASQDDFPHLKLLVFALVLALSVYLLSKGVLDITGDEFDVHYRLWSLLEFFWTLSICLEPLANVPQLTLFRKNRALNADVRLAIGLRGVYRLLYILNYIYRSWTESGYRHHFLVYAAAMVQVLLYGDFFVYHAKLVGPLLAAVATSPDKRAALLASCRPAWSRREPVVSDPLLEEPLVEATATVPVAEESRESAEAEVTRI